MDTRVTYSTPKDEDRVNSEEMIEMKGLIEEIWQDLNGQVPRALVRQVANEFVAEVAAEFHNATLTMYIPRGIRERLYGEIRGGKVKS